MQHCLIFDHVMAGIGELMTQRYPSLTYCGLMMTYGDIGLRQHGSGNGLLHSSTKPLIRSSDNDSTGFWPPGSLHSLGVDGHI